MKRRRDVKKIKKAKCPECRSILTRVSDSRPCGKYMYRRRRVCDACKYRWTTYEIPSETWKLFQRLKKLENIVKELNKAIESNEGLNES